MTANGTTVTIDTQAEYRTVASEASFTFTSGNTYTMQVQNGAYLKIGDAEFYLADEKCQYKAGDDDLYIKTPYRPCVLTILEIPAS